MPLIVPARRTAGLLVAAVTLTACGGAAEEASGTANSAVAIVEDEPSAYHGTLLDPPVERPDLTLRDTSGQPFTFDERPADEVTVVFFGYTHCPDVCPTTMADLAAARRQLPADIRERVTVAFVTEDPERDTPAVLRDWLDGFDPDFVGLRGGNADTKRVLEELYLPESKRIPTPAAAVVHPEDGHEHPGDYGLEHAGIVYAFGPGGTVIYSGGTSPRQYAEDLARLAGAG
ncbi:MAG: SCO family protein [Actinomycetota bacterium]|nr:SCO family protein [Actinomycetota bacterium]